MNTVWGAKEWAGGRSDEKNHLDPIFAFFWIKFIRKTFDGQPMYACLKPSVELNDSKVNKKGEEQHLSDDFFLFVTNPTFGGKSN